MEDRLHVLLNLLSAEMTCSCGCSEKKNIPSRFELVIPGYRIAYNTPSTTNMINGDNDLLEKSMKKNSVRVVAPVNFYGKEEGRPDVIIVENDNGVHKSEKFPDINLPV